MTGTQHGKSIFLVHIDLTARTSQFQRRFKGVYVPSHSLGFKSDLHAPLIPGIAAVSFLLARYNLISYANGSSYTCQTKQLKSCLNPTSEEQVSTHSCATLRYNSLLIMMKKG